MPITPPPLFSTFGAGAVAFFGGVFLPGGPLLPGGLDGPPPVENGDWVTLDGAADFFVGGPPTV